MYPPPKNGALTCNPAKTQCSVQCKAGLDFKFNPPFLYFCDRGNWNYFGFSGNYVGNMPWPDCESKYESKQLGHRDAF